MWSQTGISADLRVRAADELNRRLTHWAGDSLPHQSRFKDKIPRGGDRSITIRADAIELPIIRAISMTVSQGASQFGVSPNGAVFTADANGWTIGRRVDVTGLSPVLDEVADIFNQIRGGTGGRFYESDDKFFNADGRRTFVKVVPVRSKAGGASRLWDRVSSLFRGTAGGTSDPLEYTAPARRSGNHKGSTNRAVRKTPRLCPVHHIELPSHGRCDDCT